MNYDIINMKNIAKELNNRTFTDYYYRLTLIARSVFKWNNLPNGIDEKWIEKFLYNNGECVFFKDKERGFMVCQAADSNVVNCYDEPTEVMPYGIGYTGESLKTGEECVLIRNNDLATPTHYTIQLFAMRLANIERTIDVNINAQKTPILIGCSEKQRLSLKKIYQQYSGNEPVIFASKDIDVNSLNVLRTEAPAVFDKLRVERKNVWNDAMTFLGINNANQDKKERLVESEVSANDDQIEASANVMLKTRQEACKRINELFGTNISVELRIQITPELPANDFDGGEEE